jgi:hypothetical protein
MGLINLKTNLKSLQFGHDTRGGGSSGLPYIKTGLPEDSPAGKYLAGIARTSADWPLRGGEYSTVAATTDTVRISRFLTDFPRGSIFTSKQVGLQKSNPKIETGGQASRLNTQTYNLNANLLAQVLLEGDGTHIPRPGANTNELGPKGQKNKYEYIVSHKDTNLNRLVTLYSVKINTPDNISLGPIISNADKLGISTNSDTILFDYSGGPDSLYGDGNTTIFKATDFQGAPINTANASSEQVRPLPVINITNFTSNKFNTEINNVLFTGNNINNTINEITFIPTEYQQSSKDFIRPEKLPEGVPTINYFGNTLAYSKLLESKTFTDSTDLQDFRSKSLNPDDPARSQARNYNNPLVNITTRVGIGSPGGRLKKDRKWINQVNYSGQDQVNMIPLYSDATDPFLYKPEARDLIKFAFETINNEDFLSSTKVHFRAFLTNFTDNHSSEWNSQKYMGRGENFYAYQGFTRDVSFQFKVAAQSKQEMLPLWQKLNYLASSLYPDYQTGTSFMRGNLHKLTIGEYFYRTPGILKSMNISIDDNYPWEIKYSEPETQKIFATQDFTNTTNPGSDSFINSNSDADMMELPQVINVSCTFTPILNELPSLSKLTENGGGKHMLISDHGFQENFINRIQSPINKIPTQSTPVFFNVNSPAIQ